MLNVELKKITSRETNTFSGLIILVEGYIYNSTPSDFVSKPTIKWKIDGRVRIGTLDSFDWGRYSRLNRAYFKMYGTYI